jgi:D-glycero-D-manno-heptose 1,7-bisphosphate phosphatase
VNAGIHLLSPEIFDRLTILKKADLDRDVLEPMISEGSIYVYDSPEYVKDIGTPGRFYQVVKDIELGLLLKKNLSNRQKAVFIDRDGTINKYVGFLRDINDFELIQGVAERIRRINKSGYLAIVVTNQPVIARGEVSWQELNEIHNKMETLLGYEGAYLDDIFVCPHHPDKGYEFERSEYKISCECRKPKPGMLLQAANKYNIDLEKSIMIGDSDTDQEVALAVGCSFERWPSE